MITVCEEVFLLMLDYDTGRPNASSLSDFGGMFS